MHCLHCGKGFVLNKHHPQQKYCSRKCYKAEHPSKYVPRTYNLGVGKYGVDTITEENSTYLEILRKQHNPSYKYIAKNYLNNITGHREYEAAAYGFRADKIKI